MLLILARCIFFSKVYLIKTQKLSVLGLKRAIVEWVHPLGNFSESMWVMIKTLKKLVLICRISYQFGNRWLHWLTFLSQLGTIGNENSPKNHKFFSSFLKCYVKISQKILRLPLLVSLIPKGEALPFKFPYPNPWEYEKINYDNSIVK